MGKRRKNTKNQTDRPNIENQTIINNHIDYDKLAQAIVKALAEANSEKEISIQEEVEPKQKLDIWQHIRKFLETINQFLKLIYYTIFNRKHCNGEITSGLFGGLMQLVFNILAILGWAMFVSCIAYFGTITAYRMWTVYSLVDNIMFIVQWLLYILIMGIYSLIFRSMANEMAVEKDRNYIVAVFSSVVCFVALIVSLVALFKV